MNIIKPQHLNPKDSAVVRLGRLLHWSAIGLSIVGVLKNLPRGPGAILSALLVAALIISLGRGIRYVISNE